MNLSEFPYKFKPLQFELVEPKSSSPAPRCGHQIVCSSTNLYLFGGYRQNTETFRELWQFNLIDKEWKLLAEGETVPAEVISAAVLLKQDVLVVHGGTNLPLGLSASNRLHTIKLSKKDNPRFVELKMRGLFPPHSYGQSLILKDACLYTIGGTSGETYTCEIYGLNLRERKKIWRKISKRKQSLPKIGSSLVNGENKSEQTNAEADLHNFASVKQASVEEMETVPSYTAPKGRYGHKVAFHEHKLYVLGGANMWGTFDLTKIPTFDLETGNWHEFETKPDPDGTTPSYPGPRKSFGGAQVKTHTTNRTYYITGGYKDSENVFNDVWKLELATLQWSLVRSSVLPVPLYLHAATVTPAGKMYIFGGIKVGNKHEHTNEMYCGWLIIPKLAEICWEALCHYGPLIAAATDWKATLKSKEVPEKFLKRLD